MKNVIIIALLAVIVLLAVRSAVKHFRGEGGCCGGGTYKVRKKKLQRIMARRTLKIQGMHCQHCVNRVTEAIQSIPGASAAVYLNRGEAAVSMDRKIPDETLRDAVEKAGYRVAEIY